MAHPQRDPWRIRRDILAAMEREGPLRIYELRDEARLPSPGYQKYVDWLEEQGFLQVMRRKDSGRYRTVAIVLTPEGREVLTRLNGVFELLGDKA